MVWMETKPNHMPAWKSSWDDFIMELHTYFGPANHTEIKLCHLTMLPKSQLANYLIQFNTLAAQVTWGDAALHFQFYDGLPDRLKDRIAVLGKPNTLCKLVETTTWHDAPHWEWQAKWKMSWHSPHSDQHPPMHHPTSPLHSNPPWTKHHTPQTHPVLPQTQPTCNEVLTGELKTTNATEDPEPACAIFVEKMTT